MDSLTRQSIRRTRNLLEDLDRSTTSGDEPEHAAGWLNMPARDLNRYSLLLGMAAKLDKIRHQAAGLSFGGSPFDGIEAECHRELVKKFGEPSHQGTLFVPYDVLARDLNAAVGGAGGHLVGTTNVSFVDTLRTLAVVFRLGVQRLPGQTGNILLPKQTNTSTVVWLNSETATAAESNLSFTQIAGSPKTAACYVEMSDRLIRQNDPGVEAVVTRSLARDLASAVDLAVLNGSGASGQPLGIIGTPGIGGVTGTSLGYGGLVEAQVDVANANAILDPGALGYATTPLVAQTLKARQRFTGTDSPLWAGGIDAGEIEGVQALSTKQMPADTLLYGDFSSAIVAEWGVLAIEVNPFADFKAGIVGIRGLWSVDVLVQHPAAFTLITSIT